MEEYAKGASDFFIIFVDYETIPGFYHNSDAGTCRQRTTVADKHRRRAQQADDARLQSFLRRQLSVYDLSLRHRYGQQSRLLHVAWIPIQQLSLFWRRHRV